MQLRTLFRSPTRDRQRMQALQDQRTQALEDEYSAWQRENEAVSESYQSWNRAPRDERWLAYAAYLAALDREEHAAWAYRRLVEQAQGR